MHKQIILLLVHQYVVSCFDYEEYMMESANELYRDQRHLSTTEDQIIKLLDQIYSRMNHTRQIASKSATGLEYLLYTRNSPVPVKLKIGDEQRLLRTDFNYSRMTWFIVHGWTGNPDSPNIRILRQTCLENWDVNVIIVDWSIHGNHPYSVAQTKVKETADDIYQFLSFIVSTGYSLDKLIIFGHSLGAHVAGLAAKPFGPDQVGYLIAIDPSLPSFSTKNSTERLDATDAKYVEVLHTNGGVLGFLTPIGDTDIYINGGILQPECVVLFVLCPHLRAFTRYLDTMKNKRDYMAYKCVDLQHAVTGLCHRDTTLRIGGALPKKWSPGIYWASTKNW